MQKSSMRCSARSRCTRSRTRIAAAYAPSRTPGVFGRGDRVASFGAPHLLDLNEQSIRGYWLVPTQRGNGASAAMADTAIRSVDGDAFAVSVVFFVAADDVVIVDDVVVFDAVMHEYICRWSHRRTTG